MKKIYLSLIFSGLAIGSTFAQRAFKAAPLSASQINTDTKAVVKPTGIEKAGVEIWSNDFSTPGDWSIDNSGQTGSTFGWTIDAVSDGWWASNGINSTSGGNYAELSNGDPTASPGTQAMDVIYTLTTAVSIDIPNLPANTNNTDLVTLQFEEYGARFNDLQEVQISTVASPNMGPNSMDWITVRNNLGYPVYSTAGGAPYANPETVQVNIAPYITGNAGTVWIRFRWTTNYPGSTNPNAWVAYGWYIDDVKIFTNPDDDVQLWSEWIAGENNEGIEYGRTPLDQQETNYTVGGQVYNNGINDQTNVQIAAVEAGGAFNLTITEPSLLSGDTIYMETISALGLAVGTYDVDYTLTSSGEAPGSPEFSNNTGNREFEITEASTVVGSIYSQDGKGVYSNPTHSSIGTNSFTGGEDGLICASMYHIKNSAQISGFRIMLASGTVAGGEVYGSIKDTSTWFIDDMTSLYDSYGATITQQNISQGYVDVYFPSTVTLTQGAYMAAVEMYSNTNQSDVRILNDETVAQPFYASMIYIPGDQVYSNGVAFGIRLLMGDFAGVEENALSNLSVYPNPSEGLITVSNTNGVEQTIDIFDVAGKKVHTQTTSMEATIDLSHLATGLYKVKVSHDGQFVTQNVVIK